MNLVLARTREALLAHLSPAGRERARRLREAEVEATVAAERMHIARLLATVGDYHLSLAELSWDQSVAGQPALDARRQRVLDSLADAIQDEIDRFAQRRGEQPWR
ncbi:MAG: hypothetical protein ACJ786_29090 [Catenulispora sp.]